MLCIYIICIYVYICIYVMYKYIYIHIYFIKYMSTSKEAIGSSDEGLGDIISFTQSFFQGNSAKLCYTHWKKAKNLDHWKLRIMFS